jgi:hypothetical protein
VKRENIQLPKLHYKQNLPQIYILFLSAALVNTCSRDCPFSTVTKLRAGQPNNRCSSPDRSRGFLLIHSVHTTSDDHTASYPVSTRGSLPGLKQPGCEPELSISPSAEVKNA